ncbi:MAG TPA: PepSY domain-containing protein [Pirellulaceae bacterium]|nr:PepSY domain-containing protein [Pirellulaceae bacterium]
MSATSETIEVLNNSAAQIRLGDLPTGHQVQPKKRGDQLLKAFNHLLRRTHLYAGLFLLPWVFLYGVTGFLFNHATFLADMKTIEFGPTQTQGTPLAEVPTAASIARQVIDVVNQGGDTKYELVKPEAARFERGGLGATIKDESGKSYLVTLDAAGHGGTIRESRERRASGEPAPFAAKRGVVISPAPVKTVEEGLPAVLANIGMADAAVSEVRMAPLTFQMASADRVWQVNYNAQTGSLAGQEVLPNSLPDLSARTFLLRLHTAHHYPAEFNFRWIWAVIVDVMSFVMVFWGLSGIVMWWQIKRTRWLGAGLIVLSLIAAVWIGSGMHEMMLANPR